VTCSSAPPTHLIQIIHSPLAPQQLQQRLKLAAEVAVRFSEHDDGVGVKDVLRVVLGVGGCNARGLGL